MTRALRTGSGPAAPWVPVVVACAALCACGPPVGTNPPAAGVARVSVVPTATSVQAGLTLDSASFELDQLFVFGDVLPHPGDGSMPVHASINAIAGGTVQSGVELSFTTLQQGLYSTVRFAVERVRITGTYQGRPLTISLADPRPFPVAPLTITPPKELGPGKDVTFTVHFDVGSWFAGNVLANCQPATGPISIDGMRNGMVGGQILRNLGGGFGIQ